MSQMLAPYNNSMRLGQGFNSYTQQICLDQAVLLGPSRTAAKAREAITLSQQYAGSQDTNQRVIDQNTEADDGNVQTQAGAPAAFLQVMPWVKPQIVTYSSRFVDKLSDVTDAMNISGSLSIKTATIGGKANGSYVDSDKFKSSDINFHLQVKVTNQIHDAPEYSIFNKIDKVEKHQFPEIYGDCFISGWEEGGELNAIISIKVHDKSKVFEIKAGLEAEMSTPTISGKIEADFGMEKKNLSKSTETTISVTWSGGGSIKDPTEDWAIASLKKAAAAFPDFVAVTPQRTYAILTKYTSLADFHNKKDDFSPLDYESAAIYTRALLDNYMDYKAMWKQISHATYELKGNRATIEMARPGEETYKLATIQPLPASQVDAKSFELKTATAAITDTANAVTSQNQIVKPGNSIGTATGQQQQTVSAQPIQFPVFSPTFSGLIHARKVCRFEMAKIVNEVDLVAKNPKLSTDTSRDSYFLNPLVFEQLLPIVRSLSPDSAKRRIKDPNAALLLGYVPPAEEADALPPISILERPVEEHDLRLQASAQRGAWKAQDYLMQGCAGLHTEKTIHSQAVLINDLESLDATYRPSRISVWSVEQMVHGIRIIYAKGDYKSHGTCAGDPSHVWDLASDGSEIIVEVVAREGVDHGGQTVISSIAMATSYCNVFDTAIKQESKTSTPASTAAAATAEAGTDKDTAEEPASKGAAKRGDDAPSTETAKSEQAEEKPKIQEKPQTAEPVSPPTTAKTHTWARPEDGQWSLRGFFTFSHNRSGPDSPAVLCTLGAVWGKDTFVPLPTTGISAPICKSFLGLGRSLQDNIRKFKTLASYSGFADKLLMGRSVVAAGSSDDDARCFNALDFIHVHWTIRSLAFASQGGHLTGLRVAYANGREITHGTFEKETWRCDVRSDLIVAKLTAGRSAADSPAHIDTLEFIRADVDGRQSAWPLNVSTLRYLGEGNARVSKDVCEVVEQAPRMSGNARWTVRGFYGEHSGGIITRLGVVWGRG